MAETWPVAYPSVVPLISKETRTLVALPTLFTVMNLHASQNRLVNPAFAGI